MIDLFKQVNLLYVEDDITIRPIFERFLKRKVQNLFVAEDGLEGYEMFMELKPDLILTDIKMPKMNGIEMARKIRETDKNIPIIVLSAHSESDFFVEAIEAGVSGYLMKPIDKNKLFTTLERNIKVALFEKNRKEQDELLQDVIDMQPSIVFLGNTDKSMLFANKVFLDFFDLDMNLSDMENDKDLMYEELKKKNNVILKDMNSDMFWLDYIFEGRNDSFVIQIKKDNELTNFLVKTKHIEKHSTDDEYTIIITLIEMT